MCKAAFCTIPCALSNYKLYYNARNSILAKDTEEDIKYKDWESNELSMKFIEKANKNIYAYFYAYERFFMHFLYFICERKFYARTHLKITRHWKPLRTVCVLFKVQGHRFKSCRRLRFFLAPCSWRVEQIISHFFNDLKIYHLSLSHTCRQFRHCWSSQYAGRVSYMNLVYGLARHESFVAQWKEHPTGVRKIIGSNPVGESRRWILTKKTRMIYCDDHSSLSSTTAVQKWIISFILHII